MDFPAGLTPGPDVPATRRVPGAEEVSATEVRMCFGSTPVRRASNPAPVSAPIPPQVTGDNTVVESKDRLQAAQEATGFKLKDIIVTRESGSYGKVIGFARVDLPGQEPGQRALVVQYGHDEEGVDASIVLPSDADHVGIATH